MGLEKIAYTINVALEFISPTEIMRNDRKYIGVDGCKGGCIATI